MLCVVFVGFNVFYVLGSQVTRVFWLVFCSDNYFVGTFVCIKFQLGDFIKEGEGHLVVKGVWVSWSVLDQDFYRGARVVEFCCLLSVEKRGPDVLRTRSFLSCELTTSSSQTTFADLFLKISL